MQKKKDKKNRLVTLAYIQTPLRENRFYLSRLSSSTSKAGYENAAIHLIAKTCFAVLLAVEVSCPLHSVLAS